jgi:uncharacterized OB-fold protein
MEIPQHWRLKAQRYRLEGSICPICGQVNFPPRQVCPHHRSFGTDRQLQSLNYADIESTIPYHYIERVTGWIK